MEEIIKVVQDTLRSFCATHFANESRNIVEHLIMRECTDARSVASLIPEHTLDLSGPFGTLRLFGFHDFLRYNSLEAEYNRELKHLGCVRMGFRQGSGAAYVVGGVAPILGQPGFADPMLVLVPAKPPEYKPIQFLAGNYADCLIGFLNGSSDMDWDPIDEDIRTAEGIIRLGAAMGFDTAKEEEHVKKLKTKRNQQREI